MQVIDGSRSECKYRNTVKSRVPLLFYFLNKRLINEGWIDGKESVPYALKDAVEDS